MFYSYVTDYQYSSSRASSQPSSQASKPTDSLGLKTLAYEVYIIYSYVMLLCAAVPPTREQTSKMVKFGVSSEKLASAQDAAIESTSTSIEVLLLCQGTGVIAISATYIYIHIIYIYYIYMCVYVCVCVSTMNKTQQDHQSLHVRQKHTAVKKSSWIAKFVAASGVLCAKTSWHFFGHAQDWNRTCRPVTKIAFPSSAAETPFLNHQHCALIHCSSMFAPTNDRRKTVDVACLAAQAQSLNSFSHFFPGDFMA